MTWQVRTGRLIMLLRAGTGFFFSVSGMWFDLSCALCGTYRAPSSRLESFLVPFALHALSSFQNNPAFKTGPNILHKDSMLHGPFRRSHPSLSSVTFVQYVPFSFSFPSVQKRFHKHTHIQEKRRGQFDVFASHSVCFSSGWWTVSKFQRWGGNYKQKRTGCGGGNGGCGLWLLRSYGSLFHYVICICAESAKTLQRLRKKKS